MKGLLRAMILGCLLASVQCRDANAPVAHRPIPDRPIADPPIADPLIGGLSGKIAFATEAPGAFGGFLYVANANGSGLRQIPGGPAFYSNPRWSPDGHRIVVGRSNPNSFVMSVVVIDVDGQGGIATLAGGSHAT
jgi:hypothetical protein